MKVLLCTFAVAHSSNSSVNVMGCPQCVSRPPHAQRAAHLENAGYVGGTL